MLNFSEFQEYIRMNFSEIFEKEKINVELSLNSVTKNNGTEFHALTIRTEGSNIAANIYLDDSYERYVEGEDLDYLVKQIYRSVAESLVIPYEFTTVGKDLMDFDYAKDKIIMVAVNAEKNKELLADVPYQLKEDLALIYKVKLGTNNEEMATVTIHNNLLKTWGATKEEIHELAMKNTTGNAMKDGVRGLLKSAVDLLNPMRILKSLGAKLGFLIAPYVAVFLSMASVLLIVILLVFSVLQPLSNVTDGIGNFLSGLRVENSALRNTTLTQEEIEAILLASGADETQKQVLSFALSKVGYPYSQPRRTSGTAFDCSSLAFYAWQHAGVDISFGGNYPPTAASGAKMLNDAGKSLTSMDLKPGDLVYYGGSDNGRYLGIYHVAIYVGNGKSVEALNDTYGVVYQTLKTKNAVMVCRPNK